MNQSSAATVAQLGEVDDLATLRLALAQTLVGFLRHLPGNMRRGRVKHGVDFAGVVETFAADDNVWCRARSGLASLVPVAVTRDLLTSRLTSRISPCGTRSSAQTASAVSSQPPESTASRVRTAFGSVQQQVVTPLDGP